MRPWFVSLIALISLGVFTSGADAVSPLPSGWLRGAHLTGYEPDTFSGSYASETHAALTRLKADGGNLADFVQECLMPTNTSTTIDCTTSISETDASLAAGMDYAHSLGLQVALAPHLDPRGANQRGTIAPSPWGAWWNAPGGSSPAAFSYDGMMLHYATLAEQHGASIYYVGTELDSASTCLAQGAYPSCADQWASLIAQVRQIFHGKIVYASSDVLTEYPLGSGQYVPAYKVFPAWGGVDMIGVDSYFEADLPKGGGGVPDPGVPALNAAWNSFRNEYGMTLSPFADLHALAIQYGKPVIASEVGFSDGAYSAHAPADVCPDGSTPCTDTVDLQAQTDAFESYFETFANAPWYDGMVVWDFQVDQSPSQSSIQVDPRGTPAEQIIKDWWTALPVPPVPPPITPGGRSGGHAPSVSRVSLSGLLRRSPVLAGAIAAGVGAPALRSITVTLPAGLGYSARAKQLLGGVSVTTSGPAGVVYSLRVKHGVLILTLKTGVRSARLRLAGPGVIESRFLAERLRDDPSRRLRVTLGATDAAGRHTSITLDLKPR